MDNRLIRLDEYSPSEQNWLWPMRIPCGGLTLVEGDPGSNKSTLLYDIAARVTTGAAMPGTGVSQAPASAILLQAEDSLDTMRRNLEAAGADLQRVFAYGRTSASGLSLPEDLESLAAETESIGAKLIVIDPVSAYFTVSLTNDQAVRKVMQRLTVLADRLGAAIVLIRHLTKTATGNPLYRGAGSIGLIAASRSSLLVAVDPANSENRVLVKTKASLAGAVPSLSFRPVPNRDGLAIEWLGASEISAEQVMEAGRSRSRGELEEAIYVLYSILGDGPVLASEAKKIAVAAGVADRTLRRAKEVLKVISQRRGFGQGSQFWWGLPQQHEVVAQMRSNDIDELMERLCTPEGRIVPPAQTKQKEDGKSRDARDDADGSNTCAGDG